MSYILSRDAALYYEEHGSGEPLILLPGLLGTIDSHWRRFIPEFARYYHVVAVDLRGHGKTNNPSEELRLHTLVSDVYALYDRLEIESARICGYSLGGYIGLAFGIRHPGRVHALMMHATKFFWNPDAVDAMTADLDADRMVQKSPARADSLKRDHAPANGDEGWRTLLAANQAFLTALPTEALTAKMLGLAGFPVCVAIGSSDELIPRAEAEQLVTALPHAELRVLENTSHPFHTVDRASFMNHAFSFFRSAPSHPVSTPVVTRGPL